MHTLSGFWEIFQGIGWFLWLMCICRCGVPEHGMVESQNCQRKSQNQKAKSKLEAEGDGSMVIGPKPNWDEGECMMVCMLGYASRSKNFNWCAIGVHFEYADYAQVG